MDPGRNRGNPLKPTCGSHSPYSGQCWVMVLHDRALRRSPWPGFCRLPLRETPFAIDVKDQVLWVTAGEPKTIVSPGTKWRGIELSSCLTLSDYTVL